MRRLDLTGQRFGRLVAVEPYPTPTGKPTRWLCQCDCGRRIWPVTHALRQGITQSCGCLRTELARTRMIARVDHRTPERLSKARELHERGESLRSIGRHLGVDHTTVRRWIKEEPSLTKELT